MRTILNELPTVVPFIGESRTAMGNEAAKDIASELRRRLDTQDEVRMIFAAAPSQSEMLQALISAPGIDWTRVTAFHMDEYLDLPADAPQRFGLWLRRHLFDYLPFKQIHLMEPEEQPESFSVDYAALLAEKPIDIACCGIGTNCHLAFNDPPADLDDPRDVKIVLLDEACRHQQVDDLCFATFADVPTRAVTLTVPRLLAVDRIFCCVPGASKSEAVRCTLEEPISGMHPSSALRLHENWHLYLDIDSATSLKR